MADILIRGFEMSEPHNCTECPFTDYEDACIFTGVFALNIGRQTNCPLLALPPHGRLIDADAFLATVRPICEEDSFAACTLKTVKQLIINKINEFPAIIPADGGAENG